MKLHVILAMLAFAPVAGSQAPGVGGTVRGKIRVIDRGKAIAHDDVYVYLEETRHRRHALPGAGQNAEIRQVKQQFTPHVLVVPTGTTIAFPNYDNEEHNVFSPSDPPGQFDLGRYTTDHKGKTHEFDDPADVDIFCDIHKEMWAKIKIVDTRYFVVANANGEFQLDHVAPGTYRVVGWLPNNKEESRSTEKLVVTEGGTTQLADELHLQLDLVPTRPHTRKDGTQYPLYKP
jgi:plastocyanin